MFSHNASPGKLDCRLEVKFGRLSLHTLAVTVPEGFSTKKVRVTLRGRILPADFEQSSGRVLIRFPRETTIRANQVLEASVA